MLPKLNEDDWKNQGYDFWKNYRIELTKILLEPEVKIEKTPENIYKMAKETGVKPTARYFGIDPSSVRYHIKKFEK